MVKLNMDAGEKQKQLSTLTAVALSHSWDAKKKISKVRGSTAIFFLFFT